MTTNQPEQWLSLKDALELFRVTRDELLGAASEGRVRALFGTVDGPAEPRFLLSDLRKWFEDVNGTEVAEKRSKVGWAVAASVVTTKAVDKLLDGTLDSTWKVLVESVGELFREAPLVEQRPDGSSGGRSPVEGGGAIHVAPTPSGSRPATSVGSGPRDMAMRPGRDYSTRDGPGSGFMNRG